MVVSMRWTWVLLRWIGNISRMWVALNEQIRTTDENGWTPIQRVSPSPVSEQIRTTDENGWTPIQDVSPSPVFEQIRTSDENGWTPIQVVSPSPVFEQIRTTDENGWTPIHSAFPARLGLKAPALAWPELALAFSNTRPGQSHQTRLGLGLAQPRPRLLLCI